MLEHRPVSPHHPALPGGSASLSLTRGRNNVAIITFLLHNIFAAFLKRLLSTWDAAVLSAVRARYKVAAGAILMTMPAIIES